MLRRMHSRWAKSHQEVTSQRWMALLITTKIYSSLAISARRAACKLIIPARCHLQNISLWCRPLLSALRERAPPSDNIPTGKRRARRTLDFSLHGNWLWESCASVRGRHFALFYGIDPSFSRLFCLFALKGRLRSGECVWWAMLRGPIIAGCTQPANSCSLFHPLCGRFVSNGLCGTCISALMALSDCDSSSSGW